MTDVLQLARDVLAPGRDPTCTHEDHSIGADDPVYNDRGVVYFPEWCARCGAYRCYARGGSEATWLPAPVTTETVRLLAQGVLALMEDAGKLVDLAHADAMHMRPVYEAAVAWTKAECCADNQDHWRTVCGLHKSDCPGFHAACEVANAVAAHGPAAHFETVSTSMTVELRGAAADATLAAEAKERQAAVAQFVDLLRPTIARLNEEYHTTTEQFMEGVAATLTAAFEEGAK